MEIIDPSLGVLSCLPPEIRIKIWNYLTPYLHVGRSLPRKPSKVSRYQDILLTSRRIYAEVAAEVPSGYNGDMVNITVRPQYKYKSWILARNDNGVEWELEDVPDAISKGFCDLPWHELKVMVWIWPPDSTDTGQIICLYKKVRALVEILKGMRGFLALWVVLAHKEDRGWFDGDQPLGSVAHQIDILPGYLGETARKAIKWDYEMKKGMRENEIMRRTFLTVGKIMRKTTPYESRKNLDRCHGVPIKKYLDFVSEVVEHVLDVLPSDTASMLRLDRFSSWYTDKLHGNSPYEDEIKRQLLGRIEFVTKPNARYRMMRAHNPLSLAYRTAFPETANLLKHLDIDDPRGWNRDAWHCVHKQGIPPLNGNEANQTYRKWTREYDDPENGGEFVRFQKYFTFLMAREGAPYWDDDDSDFLD